MLLNLATTLAHHKRQLDQVQDQQQESGGWGGGDGGGGGLQNSRLKAQLAARTDDLADTLRTILCL